MTNNFWFWAGILVAIPATWGMYELGEPRTMWLVDLILNLF